LHVSFELKKAETTRGSLFSGVGLILSHDFAIQGFSRDRFKKRQTPVPGKEK
jgi:hypothetical protein